MAGGYLTTGQAARRLGVSRGTILNAVDAGELYAVYRMPGGAYRFLPPDVERYARWRQMRHLVEHEARAAVRVQAHATAANEASLMSWVEQVATGTRSTVGDAGAEIVDLLALLGDSLQVGATLVARHEDGRWPVVYVHDRAGLSLHAGAELPWAEAFTLALSGGPTATLIVEDARTDARLSPADGPAWRVVTVTAVPLHTADGTLYGALCTLHPAPRRMPGGEVAQLRLAGRMVVQALEVAAAREQERRETERALLAEQARARAAEALARVEQEQATEARRRAEAAEALAQSEERFRRIVETSLEGIFQLDGEDRFVFANQQTADLTGYTLEELHGMHAAVLDDPEECEANNARRAAGHRGDVRRVLFARRLRRKDGTSRWVQMSAVTLADEQGRYAGIFGMMTDNHDRALAEQALRQSEQDFRLLAENSTDVIVRLSPDLIVLYVSPSVRQVLGRAPEEVEGWRALDFVHPADRSTIAQAVARVLDQPVTETVAYRHVRADGSAVWLEIRGRANRDAVTGEVREIQAAIRDITVRKQAEEALRSVADERAEQAVLAQALAEVSALLASSLAFESIPADILQVMACVVPCTTTHVFVYRNDQVEVAGAYGEPPVSLGTVIGRLNGAEGLFPRTAEQATFLAETRGAPGWRNIAPWVDEHEVRSAIVLPLIVHGAVYGCLGVGSTMPHQFSERHFHIAQAFAERMAQALWNTRLYQLEQDRARAAEHLAALRNELVSTVSHELRTPLTAVLGYAEMLEGHWPRLNDQQRRAYLERIVLAANRQRQLIDDLLRAGSYANEKLTVRCEDLVVLDVAARATELVRASFTQQRIDEGGPPDLVARADPALLEQILVNLLDNAAKYSPEGAPVELAWEQEGDYVAIRVHDRGPGIPEAGREILFSRFGRVPGSRIRAGHVGTGLGLYLGRAQADAMGGALELESTGTSGSTFRLRLPRGGQRTCGSP